MWPKLKSKRSHQHLLSKCTDSSASATIVFPSNSLAVRPIWNFFMCNIWWYFEYPLSDVNASQWLEKWKQGIWFSSFYGYYTGVWQQSMKSVLLSALSVSLVVLVNLKTERHAVSTTIYKTLSSSEKRKITKMNISIKLQLEFIIYPEF